MNCGKCGQLLDAGAAFCGNCGQQVVLPVQQTPLAAAPVTPIAPNAPAFVPVNPASAIPPAAPAVAATATQPVPSTAIATPSTPVMQAPVVAAAPMAIPVPAAPIYATPAVQSNSNQPLVAMILGILAILTSMTLIGLPLAIAAIVVGSIGMKKGNSRGMAIAGLAMGCVSLIIFGTLFTIGFLSGVEEARNGSGLLLPVLKDLLAL